MLFNSMLTEAPLYDAINLRPVFEGPLWVVGVCVCVGEWLSACSSQFIKLKETPIHTQNMSQQ